MQDKIIQQEIERVAKLSKILLAEGDLKKYSLELSSILEYIRLLDEVDTKDVEPTYQVNELVNVMAKDRIEKSLPREQVLQEANDKDLVFIKTKGVFNE